MTPQLMDDRMAEGTMAGDFSKDSEFSGTKAVEDRHRFDEIQLGRGCGQRGQIDQAGTVRHRVFLRFRQHLPCNTLPS